MKHISAALLFVATLSSAAIAGDEPKKDKNDPERVICRREDKTGSMMGKRICHTAAEWAAIRKNAGTDANGVRNRDAVDSTTLVKPGAG